VGHGEKSRQEGHKKSKTESKKEAYHREIGDRNREEEISVPYLEMSNPNEQLLAIRTRPAHECDTAETPDWEDSKSARLNQERSLQP
jgi:hypothetical protein